MNTIQEQPIIELWLFIKVSIVTAKAYICIINHVFSWAVCHYMMRTSAFLR